MTLDRAARWASSLLMILLGACARPSSDSHGSAGSAGAATSAASSQGRLGTSGSTPAPQIELARLGPDERRALVVVLPGDASVEVDGQLIRRQRGLIELVGKVNEKRRLRAFKGERSTEETSVTILEEGASPSVIDLNAPQTTRTPGDLR